MAWIDGLDIPFSYYTESAVLRGRPRARSARPRRPRPSARAPSGCGAIPACVRCRSRSAPTATPLLAYRWADTDRALADQLALEAEGHAGATLSPGHAAVRFTNPTTGRDVLPTIRTEMHRVQRGARTQARREVGSSVYQVFDGGGTVSVGDHAMAGAARRHVRRALVAAVLGGLRATAMRSTCSASATRRSSRRCICIEPQSSNKPPRPRIDKSRANS